MNLKIFLKRSLGPILISGCMIGSFSSCTTKEISNNQTSITITNEKHNKLLKPLIKAGFKIEEKNIEDNYTMYKLENNITSYYKNVYPKSDGSNIYKITLPYDYDMCCTPIEFKKYVDDTSTITWDTVITTLKNNSNIDNNIKDIILKGINNLIDNNFNIDLTVLNYNLNTLSLRYEDKNYEIPMEVMAKFEPLEHVIYINPNAVNDPLFEDIVIHEVLGHGTNIAYKDGVYCSTCVNSAIIEDKDVLLGTVVIGKSYEEGLAEYIRYLATNKKIDATISSYSVPLYFLKLMCDSTDTDIVDYTNKGVEHLIDKLVDNDLGCVTHFIELIDIKFNYLTLGNVNYNWEYNDLLLQYFMSYTNSLIDNGLSREDTKNKINNVGNGFKSILKPLEVDNTSMLYTSSSDGQTAFLAPQYIKEQIINYVDYAYDNEKILLK